MRYSWFTTCPILVLLLVMVSLVYCPIMIVSSQSSTAVFVEPSTFEACMGESFTMTVSLSNVQNLYGLEVILNWDPAILMVANVDIRLGVETFSDGVLHESSSSPPIFIAENNLTQTRGEYRLVATSMAPAPSFSGSGKIVRITFDPVNLGDSKLDLQSQLFDYPPADREPRISWPIEHTTSNSFIVVNESALTPTPTSTPTSAPTSTPQTTLTPTPSSPSELSNNLKIEHVFVILAIILIVVFLISLALRRRK